MSTLHAISLMKYLSAGVLFLAINAQASIFGIGDKFQCGNDNVVAATIQYLKDGGVSNGLEMLNESEVYDFSRIYNRSDSVSLIKAIQGVEISITNVTTTDSSAKELSCVAKVAVKLPGVLHELEKKKPKLMKSIINRYSSYDGSSVVWNQYTYKARLSDNGKEVTINNVDSYNTAPLAIWQIAFMTLYKDAIIKDYEEHDVRLAKETFESYDQYLNELWAQLPVSLRKSVTGEQTAWIQNKELKCGKIADAASDKLPASKRIEIYKCQSKMTDERTRSLSN